MSNFSGSAIYHLIQGVFLQIRLLVFQRKEEGSENESVGFFFREDLWKYRNKSPYRILGFGLHAIKNLQNYVNDTYIQPSPPQRKIKPSNLTYPFLRNATSAGSLKLAQNILLEGDTSLTSVISTSISLILNSK